MWRFLWMLCKQHSCFILHCISFIHHVFSYCWPYTSLYSKADGKWCNFVVCVLLFLCLLWLYFMWFDRTKRTCFNCGGDHDVHACKEHRDKRRIEENRRQYRESKLSAGNAPHAKQARCIICRLFWSVIAYTGIWMCTEEIIFVRFLFDICMTSKRYLGIKWMVILLPK